MKKSGRLLDAYFQARSDIPELQFSVLETLVESDEENNDDSTEESFNVAKSSKTNVVVEAEKEKKQEEENNDDIKSKKCCCCCCSLSSTASVGMDDDDDRSLRNASSLKTQTNSSLFRAASFGNHVHTISSMDYKYPYATRTSLSASGEKSGAGHSAARRASLFVRRVSMAIPSLSADPVPVSAVSKPKPLLRSNIFS
uniref:Uncharacterized protein n=1 Tax=Syphacia muris TaxID=451379 RepID=A0A0N5AG88_9BILA